MDDKSQGVDDRPFKNDLFESNITVYPNPFNSVTYINYSIKSKSLVDIKLYNIKGQLISAILSDNRHFGQYKIPLNVKKYPSGIYLLKVIIANRSFNKKLVILE